MRVIKKRGKWSKCTGFDEHCPFICISCSFVPHFRKYIWKHTSEMSSSERTNSLLLFWSDVIIIIFFFFIYLNKSVLVMSLICLLLCHVDNIKTYIYIYIYRQYFLHLIKRKTCYTICAIQHLCRTIRGTPFSLDFRCYSTLKCGKFTTMAKAVLNHFYARSQKVSCGGPGIFPYRGIGAKKFDNHVVFMKYTVF